ncbi:hypothetical protein EST38_g9572 [Candolleomyces aberdarensis]|uniref:Uncharacterized protein n=1 Tax=Candolleomyces aberdarensis TaxID=2316362 RepID=A0A4Q2DCI1_9AGAR|nr:hypothetical protein EST38_g9572 [Candolleomyces aberdarensis]
MLLSIPPAQPQTNPNAWQVAAAWLDEYITSNVETEIARLTEQLFLTDGLVADVPGQLDALQREVMEQATLRLEVAELREGTRETRTDVDCLKGMVEGQPSSYREPFNLGDFQQKVESLEETTKTGQQGFSKQLSNTEDTLCVMSTRLAVIEQELQMLKQRMDQGGEEKRRELQAVVAGVQIKSQKMQAELTDITRHRQEDRI